MGFSNVSTMTTSTALLLAERYSIKRKDRIDSQIYQTSKSDQEHKTFHYHLVAHFRQY